MNQLHKNNTKSTTLSKHTVGTGQWIYLENTKIVYTKNNNYKQTMFLEMINIKQNSNTTN